MKRLRGLGIGLGIVALTVGIIAGAVTAVQHIPRPEKKMEWVQQADAVIVQMETLSPSGLDFTRGYRQHLAAPTFTLYGDGTFIAERTNSDNTYSIHTAKLSTEDVQGLLKFIRDEGFFDFSYNEAGGNSFSPSRGPTTYLYAALKDTQNVSGGQFYPESPAEVRKEPTRFQRLFEIKSRIDDMASKVIAEGHASEYTPDVVILVVAQSTPEMVAGVPRDWPFPNIDLASIAPASGVGEQRIRVGEAAALRVQLGMVKPHSFAQNGLLFNVGLRPVLPYEENFPEFEPPSVAPTP